MLTTLYPSPREIITELVGHSAGNTTSDCSHYCRFTGQFEASKKQMDGRPGEANNDYGFRIFTFGFLSGAIK